MQFWKYVGNHFDIGFGPVTAHFEQVSSALDIYLYAAMSLLDHTTITPCVNTRLLVVPHSHAHKVNV